MIQSFRSFELLSFRNKYRCYSLGFVSLQADDARERFSWFHLNYQNTFSWNTLASRTQIYFFLFSLNFFWMAFACDWIVHCTEIRNSIRMRETRRDDTRTIQQTNDLNLKFVFGTTTQSRDPNRNDIILNHAQTDRKIAIIHIGKVKRTETRLHEKKCAIYKNWIARRGDENKF